MEYNSIKNDQVTFSISLMGDFFSEYKNIIVFLHVISAVIWVGGMIATRFATHYALAELEGSVKLARTAHVLKNLFKIVVPFVAILIITALIMAIAMDLHHSDMKVVVMIKESIWTIMSISLAVMIFRRSRAQRYIDSGDFALAKGQLEIIGKIMVPINIVLGIIAIYLGVTLS